MRYKTKTKDCHLIVKAKASWGEDVDTKALDAFSRLYLRGFLKPKVVQKNAVEYSGPIGISLYERLKKPLSKRDFLFIMEQIVVTVQKIQSNNLSMNKLILDTHYVFINDITKEIQFLYLPLTKETENADIVAFIESIIYSIVPAAEQDTEFVSRFNYFLKAQKSFDPELVEKFILKEDRSVVNTIKKQNVGQSGFMTSSKQHYYEHYDNKQEERETTSGSKVDDDATGLLYGSNVVAGMPREVSEATGLLYDGNVSVGTSSQDYEATGLLYENNASVGGSYNAYEATGMHYENNASVGASYDAYEATGLLYENNASAGASYDAYEATGLRYENNVSGGASYDAYEATGLLYESNVSAGAPYDTYEATGMHYESNVSAGVSYDTYEATGLLYDNTPMDVHLNQPDEEGTTLLSENQDVRYPTLFRILTEETISINKPVFRLGKERSYVDYFVSNNNAVSRSHADIITRGNKYFVSDLNSKNHTYINGQMIAVQCETEICNGDRLKLGNEEFVFQVEQQNTANICQKCGKKIEHSGKFCIYCGTSIM